MTDCYSDQLKNTLLVRLPGAGVDAVELEMGNAAHEFFLESGAWHEIVYANMITDRTRYELWPESGLVGYITDLQIDGHGLTPVSGNSIAVGRWNGHFQVMSDFGTIEVHPAPTQTKPKAIIANVTVVPQSCACDIPPDIMNHYFEALLDNSLGRLYSHVNKPYTNLNLATYHTMRYRAHLTRARRIVAGGNVRAAGPWVYPQIAPGRNRRGSYLPRGV
jgi:hypothetical protein